MRNGGFQNHCLLNRCRKSLAVLLLISIVLVPFTIHSPATHADNGIAEDIYLVELAEEAIWRSGESTISIEFPSYPGRPGDTIGYARYVNARLEDGSEKWVLQTHPYFSARGWIEGIFEMTIPAGPEGVVFMTDIGFIEGATLSDGVRFKLKWVASATSTTLLDQNKDYDGELLPVYLDMARFAGQTGQLRLEVSAGSDSTQDWAAWHNPRVAVLYEPDSPYKPCFNNSGLWNPGGDLLEVATQTVGTRDSCTDSGGKPYYQMLLGCNELWRAREKEKDPDKIDRGWWCSEAISYWHREANMPYIGGYHTEWHPSWLCGNVEQLVAWYQVEEMLTDGRGRWIESSELDYDNFQPGVNAPCPGAYMPLMSYIPRTTTNPPTWTTESCHSQMVDEMIIYTFNGEIEQVDVKIIEGNAGPNKEVMNTEWYRNVIDYTPLGTASCGGNKKIRGWGIDLIDGEPYCPSDRITYIHRFGDIGGSDVEESESLTQMRMAVNLPDPPEEESALVQKLIAYATTISEKKPKIVISGAKKHETAFDSTKPLDLRISRTDLALHDLNIEVDLGTPHPLSIKCVELEMELPEGTPQPLISKKFASGPFLGIPFLRFYQSSLPKDGKAQFIKYKMPAINLSGDIVIKNINIQYDWGPDTDIPWNPAGMSYQEAECPTGCECLTQLQAKQSGYTPCQGELTQCGVDSNDDPTYCFEKKAEQPCPTGCECLTSLQAKQLGYTPCQGELTQCGVDSNDDPTYCFEEKAANITPGNIFIDPIQDKNPVGTQHTVTITIYDINGKPIPYTNVFVNVTGAHNLSTSQLTTDSSGRVYYSYAGKIAGTDIITATADKLSAKASKEWYSTSKPAKIAVSPLSDINPIGSKHTLTATVWNSSGKPVSGIAVKFIVSGTNNLTGGAITDSNGNATFTYSSKKTGKDTITVTTGDLKLTATKSWIVQK